MTANDNGRGSRGPDIALTKGVSASTPVGEDAGRPAVPGDDDSVGARRTSRVDPTVGENGELVERPALAPEIELLKVLVLVRIRVGADSVAILHHPARGIRGFGDGIAAVLGRAAGGRVIGSSDNGDQGQEEGEWQSHFVRLGAEAVESCADSGGVKWDAKLRSVVVLAGLASSI